MLQWCFLASLALLLLFCVISLIERLVLNLGEMGQWKLRIAKFACLVFSGGALLFGWQQDISFPGAAESLYSAIKLFFADGNLYEELNPPLPSDSWQSLAYFALYYVICGITIYCTAAAVISLFKNFAAMRELKRRGRWKNLCVFSELNEKNLAIAESVLENTKRSYSLSQSGSEEDRGFFTRLPQTMDNSTYKLSFVFCDVFEQHAEHSYELVERARKLGALCLKNDITEVHARLRRARCYRGSKKRLTRFFLTGMDEAENVRQAIVITDSEREEDNGKRIKNLAIFVIANGEANGEVIDSLNVVGDETATFFVRRLNPAQMLAYDILANKQNYLVNSDDPDKQLHVLVAGMGQYGMELVKMLCWFYQRHAGGITVHVVDRERGVADRIRATCPELINYTSPKDPTEDMQFSLVVHEGVDLFSDSFCSLLKSSLADINAAFVTLGNDDLNAEAAIRIRRTLDRVHFADIAYGTGRYMTPTEDLVRIFAIVHSDKRCKNFAKSSHHNIHFVGNDSAIYDYQNIYDHQKEVAAIKKHKNRRGCSYREAVNTYNAREYDRSSSLASAYYLDLYQYLYGKITLDDAAKSAAESAKKAVRTPEIEAQLRTENKRWNAYMRSIGYICINDALSPAERDKLFWQGGMIPLRRWARGKWHNSIAPFSSLGEAEQANNAFR